MFFKSAFVGTLLAAGHATAFKGPQVNALLEPGQDVEEVLRRDAELMATLTQRQDANSADSAPLASLTPATGDASGVDQAKWEQQTKEACMSTLSNLNGQASNPSGIAVCYNLPFLDNKTGVFQAELRMYNVSAPINPWVGVTAADVSMTLSYLGATVQNMRGNFTKRDLSWPVSEGMLVERQDINTMTELKVLMYVGRINENLMGSAMTQYVFFFVIHTSISNIFAENLSSPFSSRKSTSLRETLQPARTSKPLSLPRRHHSSMASSPRQATLPPTQTPKPQHPHPLPSPLPHRSSSPELPWLSSQSVWLSHPYGRSSSSLPLDSEHTVASNTVTNTGGVYAPSWHVASAPSNTRLGVSVHCFAISKS